MSEDLIELLTARLDDAIAVRGRIDDVLLPLKYRFWNLESAAKATLPCAPSCFNPNRMAVIGYTRTGVERRTELRVHMDALARQMGPLKRERVEAEREIKYIASLIEDEEERRNPKVKRRRVHSEEKDD